MAFPGGGKRALQRLLRIAGVSLLCLMTRQSAALTIGQLRLFELGHAAMTASVERLQPRYTGTAPVAFAWAGRSQWLVLREGPSRLFELQLRSSLADVASVTDQSDGRTIVRISGPRARDTLAKGVHIDLHPSVFRPGDTAISIVSNIGVQFWQIDPAPTYEFAMFRSFAVSFWEWLVDAAAEFGVSVNDISMQGSES